AGKAARRAIIQRASHRWPPGYGPARSVRPVFLCSAALGMNARICRGQARALRARQGLWPCRAVRREPWTPPAEGAADGEARHGEQPEPLRARANTRPIERLIIRRPLLPRSFSNG